MVVPNNQGFPTKNDHFGAFWGYHHLRKHPYNWVGLSSPTYPKQPRSTHPASFPAMHWQVEGLGGAEIPMPKQKPPVWDGAKKKKQEIMGYSHHPWWFCFFPDFFEAIKRYDSPRSRTESTKITIPTRISLAKQEGSESGV